MLQVAQVEEALCIGCTACFQVCPTGALVGAAKQIHAVIEELCTGCGACVPACPVPCITLQPWAASSHPLQGVNAGAGVALAASYQQRFAEHTAGRVQAADVAKPMAVAPELPPELASLAAAARQKSLQKYKKMGPLRRPRALPRSGA